MLVIPAIDLAGGRSRVVHWPGASAGVGAPTDRPERIAETFVSLGARLIHVVDADGARAGVPVNLEAVGAIASRVAVPIQVAGGIESAEAVRLVFAAGATRIVLTMDMADRPEVIRDCLAVAGDWLAMGLDPRPERVAAFPWHRDRSPTVPELVGELVGIGVRRFVLAHGGGPDSELIAELVNTHDAEVLVAGGVSDIAGLARLRDAGVSGVILGEALLSGAIDYVRAMEAAA